MIHILTFIFNFIIYLFRTDYRLYIETMVLKTENIILKRKLKVQRIQVNRFEKFILVILNLIGDIRNIISIVSPKTLLNWQSRLISSFWTFWSSDSHPGRKSISSDIKNLILTMKNDNPSWGAKRIRDELLMKLQISLHKSTIQKILKDFRKRGKIRKGITWKKFLESHIDSIFAMDFFTVDTINNQRFYVFFIICHKTREIVHCAISQYPTREFVKQQLVDFEDMVNQKVYMIRDRTGQFWLDYSMYNIVDVCTSIEAPNMNAIAERFVKSVRSETLDHFLLFSQKQVSKIIFSYINYYNNLRPHQGINSIPKGIPPDKKLCDHWIKGKVCSENILGGLVNHYFYEDAA